jgi:hypothetical protein
MNKTLSIFALLFAVGFSLVSCSKPPKEEIQQAEATVDSARSAGAETYARDEFFSATEALGQSKANLDSGKYGQARDLALLATDKAHGAMAKTSATKKQLESDLRDSLDQLRASLDSVKVFLDAAANKKRLPGKTLAARRGEWKEIEESITSLETKVSAGELQSATENVIQVRSQLSHLDKELAKVAATHHTVGAKKTGRKI